LNLRPPGPQNGGAYAAWCPALCLRALGAPWCRYRPRSSGATAGPAVSGLGGLACAAVFTYPYIEQVIQEERDRQQAFEQGIDRDNELGFGIE
jgi:hypothetical protein